MNIFLPLLKVDAVQRMVWGTAAMEVADKSGEIMDYATAKPAFEKWSADIAEATDGKSLGNVRLMHGKTAIGKVVELVFDDLAKAVKVCVKVVDDAAWKLVQEGVLSGFSIGGGYAKRWPDPVNKSLKRYTPALAELSMVDSPCIPGSTFSMIKADGVEVEVEIKADGHLAKVAGEDDDDIEAKLAAALEKAAPAKKPYGDVEYADAKNNKYPIDTPAHIRAAWSYINMPKNQAGMDDAAVSAIKDKIVAAWKAKIDKGGPPSAEKMALFGDLAKSGALLHAIEGVALEKGFYTVQRVSRALELVSEIASSVIWEEMAEQDSDSTLPQTAVDMVASMKSFLVDMINEEMAEFMSACESNGGNAIALLAPCMDEDAMEMAAKAFELLKADAGLLEKIGAKISNANMKHVQAMHDHSAQLGAKCDSGNCDKAAEADALMKAENTRLRKAARTATVAIEELTAARNADMATLADLTARLAKLESRPAPGGPVVISLSKADDDRGLLNGGGAPKTDPAPVTVLGKVEWSSDMRERAHQAAEVLRKAGYAPGG